MPSCLIADGEPIVIPPGTNDVHFEAELVIVIGRKAKNVSEAGAADYILGVTCGNDVSARDWQKERRAVVARQGERHVRPGRRRSSCPASTTTTCGCSCGSTAKSMQDERTSQLIHSVPKMVSFISQSRDAAPRRPDLHRHARPHQRDQARRQGRSGD